MENYNLLIYASYFNLLLASIAGVLFLIAELFFRPKFPKGVSWKDKVLLSLGFNIKRGDGWGEGDLAVLVKHQRLIQIAFGIIILRSVIGLALRLKYGA